MGTGMGDEAQTYLIGIDVSTRAVVCAAVDEEENPVASTCIDIRGLRNYALRHTLIEEELCEFFSGFESDGGLEGLQVYIESPPYVQNIKIFKQLVWVEYNVLIACHGIFPQPRYHVQSFNPIEWRKLSIGDIRAKKIDLKNWLDKAHDIRPEKGPFQQDLVDAFCMAFAGLAEYKEGVQNG